MLVRVYMCSAVRILLGSLPTNAVTEFGTCAGVPSQVAGSPLEASPPYFYIQLIAIFSLSLLFYITARKE